MTSYAHVVFIQDEDGREITDKLFNVDGVVAHGVTAESITATFDYLKQWDYGDELEESDETGAGSSDLVIFEDGGQYVMTANLGLGYVSLSRVVCAS